MWNHPFLTEFLSFHIIHFISLLYGYYLFLNPPLWYIFPFFLTTLYSFYVLSLIYLLYFIALATHNLFICS